VPIYDGIVTVDEDDVQVILGVDENKIRLSAGGLEIGEWSAEDCAIDSVGDGVFTITAENETLTFVPNNPTTFAAAMNDGSAPDEASGATMEESMEPAVVSPSEADQIPEPKPITMVVFYALAAITGVLGIWALITIVF
jgi:hypothetical protein